MGKTMPNHVGIILDGNGRWATMRNLPRSEGHLMGANNLKKLAPYVFSKGVKYLSVFVFSTENFKRESSEVDYLMNLFLKMFSKEENIFVKKNIKIIFSGRKEPLRDDVYNTMKEIEKRTTHNTGGVLNICLNYGGVSEIVDTAKKLALKVKNNEINVNDIDEDYFLHNLYNDLPKLDYIIRTSGELRISNFMIYSGAYAEFDFPLTFFPDYDNKEFDRSIERYFDRDRRFGGNSKKVLK